MQIGAGSADLHNIACDLHEPLEHVLAEILHQVLDEVLLVCRRPDRFALIHRPPVDRPRRVNQTWCRTLGEDYLHGCTYG
jgi:hypothetical protein